MWDVFICHAKEDLEFAKRVYHDLKRSGLTPWLDCKDLLPGQEWEQEIYQVMKESSYILLLFSSHSLNKRGFVQKELKKAFDLLDEFPPPEIFLIPIRLEPCEPKDERLQKLHWCDFFNSYEEGLKQIRRVLLPKQVYLRSEPLTISTKEAMGVFELNKHWEPLAYIQNNYEDRGNTVMDHAIGLIWQRSGSDVRLLYSQAQEYVQELNRQKFAGYDDWRLPTIPELTSLLEPETQSNDLFLNPIFDEEQWWCWSTDTTGPSGSAWGVSFRSGVVHWPEHCFVRCVRS